MKSAAEASPPRWVWLALTGAHLLALAYQLWAGHWFFPDSDRYLEAARNLRDHATLYAWPWPAAGVVSPQEYSIRPPGYPMFLLLLGLKVPLILLVQNGLSLLNLGLIARWVARRYSLTPRRWGFFLLLALTAPAQLIYANALMSEVLVQTLVIGLWLTLTRYLAAPTGRALAGAAGLAAGALLIKPVFVLLSGAMLLLGLWGAIRRRQPALALLGALPLLVALGWQARNAAHTGYFHFSSIAEINLLRYNARAALRATEGPAAADAYVAAAVTASETLPDFASRQRYLTGRATAALGRHPGAYAGLHALGMANCLLDPGRFDVSQFLGLPSAEATGLLRAFDADGYRGLLRALARQPWGLLLVLGAVLVANGVRAAAFGRFLLAGRAPLTARLAAGALVLYVVGLTGPLGASRFLVPVLPLLLLGAAAPAPGWLQRLSTSAAATPNAGNAR